jgi:hypothetical protein
MSCTNKTIILETADNYTRDKVLPLFQDAQITNRVPFIEAWKVVEGNDRIMFFKQSYLKTVMLINRREKVFLDARERKIRLGDWFNRDESDLFMLTDAIDRDVIEAIRKAKSSEGFYIVDTAIKYGNDKYYEFEVIISKDLKVLNTPVDTVILNKRRNANYTI